MMQEEILTWLENPDYPRGVKIYEKYGDNVFLLHQFRHSRPSKMGGYLMTELKKMAKVGRYKPVGEPIRRKPLRIEIRATNKASESIQGMAKDAEKLSADLGYAGNDRKQPRAYAQVVDFRKRKFVEMARLRNGLGDMATPEKRLEAMEKIEVLNTIVQDLWKDLDFYDLNGKWEGDYPLDRYLQPELEAKPENLDAIRSELERVRKRQERAQKRLEVLEVKEGVESSKYKKKELELAQIQAERAALKQKLDDAKRN